MFQEWQGIFVHVFKNIIAMYVVAFMPYLPVKTLHVYVRVPGRPMGIFCFLGRVQLLGSWQRRAVTRSGGYEPVIHWEAEGPS